MIWWQWIILGIVIISAFCLLLNKKIVNADLFKDQLNVYYKCRQDGTRGKICLFDIFCFLALPLIISCCIVWGFDYQLDIESTNALLTVTSILFSVLFTVLSIVTAKTKSTDDIERKVVKEAFTTITATTMWLVFCILVSIVYLLLLSKSDNRILFKILTNCLFAILIHSFALLLMTIKRFYMVFSTTDEKQGGDKDGRE